MNKNVAIPFALLLLSGLFTIMFNPAILFASGVIICVIAILKYRALKAPKSKLSSNLLFRSGIAVITGAIVAVAFVLAAMSGLFGK